MSRTCHNLCTELDISLVQGINMLHSWYTNRCRSEVVAKIIAQQDGTALPESVRGKGKKTKGEAKKRKRTHFEDNYARHIAGDQRTAGEDTPTKAREDERKLHIKKRQQDEDKKRTKTTKITADKDTVWRILSFYFIFSIFFSYLFGVFYCFFSFLFFCFIFFWLTSTDKQTIARTKIRKTGT